MSAQRLDPYAEPPLEGLRTPGVWIRPPSGGSPGIWALRLRFRMESEESILIRLDATEHWELSLDSETIARSGPLDPEHYDSSEAMFRLDLSAGTHELFAYIWSFENSKSAPGFALKAVSGAVRIDTGSAPWKSARLENVEFLDHPSNAAYRIVGEPTGPGGMDRGASWEEPVVDRELLTRVPAEMIRPLVPVSVNELTGLEVVGAEASGFVSVLGPDGFLKVESGQSVTVSFELPKHFYIFRLRASGGPGSSIAFEMGGDPPMAAIFEPRGFRQDFSSFSRLYGGRRTITLNGGERGMALFRLQLWDERP